DEQPDRRDISVAVRHSLSTDLHNPYDGYKRACKPKPSHCKVRKSLCPPNNRESCTAKKKYPPHDLPQRPQPGVRIKESKIIRPDRLRDVSDIGNKSVGDTNT